MNEGYLSYEKGVVLAHYTGMYTAKHAQETTHDIITYLHENNCQLPPMTKIAIVAEEHEKHRRLFDFYETTCYNVGYQVNIFKKILDAKRWLMCR